MMSVSPNPGLSSSGSAFIRPIPRSPMSSSSQISPTVVLTPPAVGFTVMRADASSPAPVRSPGSADTLSSVEYRSFGEIATGMMSVTPREMTPSVISNQTPPAVLAVPAPPVVRLRAGEGGSQLFGLGVEPSMGSVSAVGLTPNHITVPEPPLVLSAPAQEPSVLDWPEDHSKVEGMTTDLTSLRRRLEEQRLHLDDLMIQQRQENIAQNSKVSAARAEVERLQKEDEADRSRLQVLQRQQEKLVDQIDEMRRRMVDMRTDREHDAEVLRDRSDEWQEKRRREMDDLRAAIEGEKKRILHRKTEFAIEANGFVHKLEASVEEAAADVEDLARKCELESAETKELELRQDGFEVQLDRVRKLIKDVSTFTVEDEEHNEIVCNVLREIKLSLGELELETTKLKEDLQHDSLKIFRELRRVATETDELQRMTAYDGMKLARISKRTDVGLAELDGLRHEARRLYRAQKSEQEQLTDVHEAQLRERDLLGLVDRQLDDKTKDIEKTEKMVKTRERKAYEVENGPIQVSEKHLHHLHKQTDVVHVHRTPYTAHIEQPKAHAPIPARPSRVYPIKPPGVPTPASPSSSTSSRRRHSGPPGGATRKKEQVPKRSSSPPLPPPRSAHEALRGQQLRSAFGPACLPSSGTQSTVGDKISSKSMSSISSISSQRSFAATAGNLDNSSVTGCQKEVQEKEKKDAKPKPSCPWDEPLDLHGDGKPMKYSDYHRSSTPPTRGVATPPPRRAPGAYTPPPRHELNGPISSSSWRTTTDGGRAKDFCYKF